MSLWSSCIPATFSCLTMHYNGRWQVAGGNLVEALFLQFSICKGRRRFFTCSHPGKAEAKNKKCNCCHFQLHPPLVTVDHRPVDHSLVGFTGFPLLASPNGRHNIITDQVEPFDREQAGSFNWEDILQLHWVKSLLPCLQLTFINTFLFTG